MRTDYHIHLHESNGLSLEWLKVYVEAAQAAGIEEIGISEHAYFFDETAGILTHPWAERRRTLKFKDYVALYEAAQAANLPVRFGLEMDYIPGKEEAIARFIERYPFDYVIGSVHWIGDWGIDLAEFRDEYERRKIDEVYEAYFDQVVTLAESRLFQFVGHIDLVKIFGYRPKDEAFLEAQYDRVVAALQKSGTLIEVSTAGLRKPVGEIYPSRRLLEKCRAAGVGIVLSSDAHHPKHVGYRFEEAVALAKSVGYTEIHRLERGKATPVPLT
ncbi:histidinol-phosphatase [Hydrogenibacillus sp. N12]|uniref:histidinol-phosphatase n=1 Tax=Hydrogenibacillus sp. N12 TaxID=2866627 RepID=UPI001C7CD36E|nr:histidinol-phosphatase [Hydrogenibacillus sp. N12]QZA32080.1 histidinol-phosphatase [Hydrogenibacillus sp. N12]